MFPHLKTHHRDRAGFSGAFIDHIVETKGVRLLSPDGIAILLTSSHHVPFSLILSTERKPSTMVNISLRFF